MALGMSAADIAVSTKGINQLITQFDEKCKAAKKVCDPSQENALSALIKEIKKYWVGTDRDAFITDLKNACKSLSTRIDYYMKEIDMSLKDYDAKFTQVQTKTYTQGTIKV